MVVWANRLRKLPGGAGHCIHVPIELNASAHPGLPGSSVLHDREFVWALTLELGGFLICMFAIASAVRSFEKRGEPAVSLDPNHLSLCRVGQASLWTHRPTASQNGNREVRGWRWVGARNAGLYSPDNFRFGV